eukprot:2490624-Prymnesium_polylepis.1
MAIIARLPGVSAARVATQHRIPRDARRGQPLGVVSEDPVRAAAVRGSCVREGMSRVPDIPASCLFPRFSGSYFVY